MRRFKMLLSLLLFLSILLTLVACDTDQEDTQPTSTTGTTGTTTDTGTETTFPTEQQDDALALYVQAAERLQQMQDVALGITMTEVMTIGGEAFTTTSAHNIYYQGIGTDDFTASVTSSVSYNGYASEVKEIYAENRAYSTLYSGHYQSEMTAEEFTARYLPLVLIDETLYGTYTCESVGTYTDIRFEEGQELESWLASEVTELISSSAVATIDYSGNLTQYTYTASYYRSGAVVTTEVSVEITQSTNTIRAPGNASEYVELDYLDGPKMLEQICGYLLCADSVSFNVSEYTIMDAAAAIVTSGCTLNTWGSGSDMMAKMDSSYYLMDYSTNETYGWTMEETFLDSEYTYSIDGGEVMSDSSVTGDVMTGYIQGLLTEYILLNANLTSAVCTDLGSLLLIEFTGDHTLGQYFNELLCTEIYDDPGFLDSYATAFETLTMDYYIAIDKYQGLPTAIGILFEGYHTIDGYDYYMGYQIDQSIYLASLDSYEAITSKTAPDTEPEQKATPAFYHVTGKDGQEMWLLGTIHVGDSRTGYLPQEIYDAFNGSDALAVECNTRAFEDQLSADESLQNAVAEAYYYSDGSLTAAHAGGESIYNLALQLMKATGNYFYNAPYMKVSLWASSIDNFYTRQAYNLSSGKGVDNRLMVLAEDSGKEILEIESNIDQIQMLYGWSDELQQLLLTQSVNTKAHEYITSLEEMYELWCSGDATALTEYINTDVPVMTDEEMKLYEEYNKAMSWDRNAAMTQAAIEYLESGDTIFYAVGLAHVLAEDGLVNTLRDAGYTVELVEYE